LIDAIDQLGRTPIVSLNDPAAVKTLLQSSVNITKADFYRFLWPWLGISLLTR
jgi:hypothetical protein